MQVQPLYAKVCCKDVVQWNWLLRARAGGGGRCGRGGRGGGGGGGDAGRRTAGGGDAGKRPASSRGDASRRRPAGGDDARRGSPLASATMDATFGSARAAPYRMATSCPTAGWLPSGGAHSVLV